MMKFFCAAAAVVLSAGAAGAQNMYDAINFSRNEYYGSARSMALGNAVTGSYFFGRGYGMREKEYNQDSFVKNHALNEWAQYNNYGSFTSSFTSQFTIDEGRDYNAVQASIQEYIGKELPNLIKSGVTDMNWNAFCGALRTRKCDSNIELAQNLYDRLH